MVNRSILGMAVSLIQHVLKSLSYLDGKCSTFTTDGSALASELRQTTSCIRLHSS